MCLVTLSRLPDCIFRSHCARPTGRYSCLGLKLRPEGRAARSRPGNVWQRYSHVCQRDVPGPGSPVPSEFRAARRAHMRVLVSLTGLTSCTHVMLRSHYFARAHQLKHTILRGSCAARPNVACSLGSPSLCC